jgi:hypothetical protein
MAIWIWPELASSVCRQQPGGYLRQAFAAVLEDFLANLAAIAVCLQM